MLVRPASNIIHPLCSVIHNYVVEEMSHPGRKPSAGMTAVRVVLITTLATLLCFAVALFLGIVGFALANLAIGGGLNMTLAFRSVALPIGVATLVVAFALALRSELRRYRQARSNYVEWKKIA